MTQAKTAVVAIALCVALQIATTQGKVTTVAQKSKFFGSNRLIFDQHSFENTTFVYASCTSVEGKTDKSCKVYLAINDLEPIKECSLNLKLRNDNREISPYMRTFLMGKNMAIISYAIVDKNQDRSERNKRQSRPPRIRFAIVNMSNCDIRDITAIDGHKKDHPLNVMSVDVVPYDNTFDVIFESHTLCGDKFCRVTIDDKGIKLTEDIPWFKNLGEYLLLEPLERRSSKKGHLLINLGMQGPTQVALVKDNQITDLQKTSALTRMAPMALSTSHGAVSVCYVASPEPGIPRITCEQYDSVTGQRKFQASIKLGYASSYGAVHNLPEGKGFLLMTPECTDSQCSGTISRYHVHKLAASGQNTGYLLLNGLECPSHSGLVGRFYTNEANQHCLTIVCFATNNIKGNPDGDEWLKFETKCFDDKDLSQ